jgi:carboxymethylenebutenolidase
VRTETLGTSHLVVPEGAGPYPGVIVVHEAFGLNDNIRGICRRFAEQGYAALGVDLFAGRSRAVCMARLFIDWLASRLDDFAIVSLKEAITQLADRADVDAERMGAVGFCIGGTVAITWACTDNV